jgi:ABC-type sugar transport system ATPase subunit
VLKDGKFVTEMKASEADENKLIRAMVGRAIGDTYANLKRNDKFGDVVLEVKNLNNKHIHDVSFTLRKGEVLAALVGPQKGACRLYSPLIDYFRRNYSGRETGSLQISP